MLNLTENDLYYFDEKAADRAVKFIETRLCHYEDRWAGNPFLLLAWQRTFVRDIFGWKRKDNHLRRFREAYIEIAKGNGKSPLLAAIGCYMLLADGEEGALGISAATDYKQANVTFDCGKKMLEASPRLAPLVRIKQYVIEAPKNCSWVIISGTAAGKAGQRPTFILMDEAWEWPNRKLYDSLTRNARKRSQPMIIVATNAGMSRDIICWELHERARRVLSGESKDDTLYAIIFAASEKDDAADPKIWAKANPALGQVITEETLAGEWIKALEVPALEAEFRRLHLSQWVQGANKWLDMAAWDKCTAPFKLSQVKDLPLITALDMSLVDDLSALADLWIGPDRLFLRCKFWLPKKTAAEYESKNSIPFTEWEKGKFIKLLNSETIDAQAMERIANVIIARKEKFKNFRCLTYDRNRATNVIALCEAKKITCIPMEQNWKLSPAAEELTRRLKATSMQIAPNPVLRWNAANVEAKSDAKGNIHIVKEATLGKYKGRKSCKIDGIAALVTGLAQVLRELMTQPKGPSVYETRGVFSV